MHLTIVIIPSSLKHFCLCVCVWEVNLFCAVSSHAHKAVDLSLCISSLLASALCKMNKPFEATGIFCFLHVMCQCTSLVNRCLCWEIIQKLNQNLLLGVCTFSASFHSSHCLLSVHMGFCGFCTGFLTVHVVFFLHKHSVLLTRSALYGSQNTAN